MKSGEDYLQKGLRPAVVENLPDALKINATIKKPAHEWIVKAVPTGIMEMTDFGPRASHGGEGGALALQALHPD